ncbi:MAG: metallophosphoesterase family protein [Myxococcales bacterium]|nr:metallophosphoesterase family protein [Myxococcales bacterium]
MLDQLMQRFIPEYLSVRMRMQVDYITRLFGDGVGGVHLENIDAIFPLMEAGLRVSGLWKRGLANMLKHVVSEQTFQIPNLPPAFDGVRVLHLSDLHIDVDPKYHISMGARFADAIRPLSFDVAVITGDFRFATFGPYDRVHPEVQDMMPALDCELGVYGILGNHDFIEQVPYLEDVGVKMLVNEAAPLERDGEQLWLVGVDDPHFYGLHSFGMALMNVPDDACKLMLIHSPEIAEEALENGGALYLTGHTHGGQLCLPGGMAPYVNARCPRERVCGRWQHGSMHGYTSAGTGSSGLPVRFNRPPEIAIHTLVRG